MYTEAQQDANWDNLSSDQRDYFNRLAEGDPERTGQAFFEDTVPPSLQDNPDKLEVFLNGGTATAYEWEPTRGAAGGEWVEVEREFSDRDWSHDVSRANGGSDSADNGRFEDASTNRSRGAANSTTQEQAAADAHAQADAEFLEDSETFVQSLEEVAEVGAWATALDVAGGLLEASLDGLLPVAASAVAAKKVADRFESTTDKVGWGALAGGGAALYFASPAGPPTVGAYVLWKLGERGVKLWNKHAAA